jgi:hypothetical protein
MTSTTCPSCGTSIESGAVLCIECGFDSRTGQKHETKVALAAKDQGRRGGHDRFACERFDLCLLQGVSTKILVCDNNADVVAYIHARARPLWTCFTILVAVPLFFLVPAGLGFLFFVVAEWAEIPAPGMLLAIVLMTFAVAAGLLASLCTAGLMTPRRRLNVWEDQTRKQLLMRVRETWKFGVARVSVIGADGHLVGRIYQHRRRNRYVLVNHLEQPQAVLLSGKVKYASDWADHSPAFTLLLFLLLGLPGLLLAVLPRKERTFTESFLYRISSFLETPTTRIGRVTFNPAREDPYRVELSSDPDHAIDRKLVVGLMGLLEWWPRDTQMWLAELWEEVEEKGVDPEPHYQKIGKISNKQAVHRITVHTPGLGPAFVLGQLQKHNAIGVSPQSQFWLKRRDSRH